MTREQDNREAIDLLRTIRSRASTNLTDQQDVDRLREVLIRDAMAILTDAEVLLGVLAKYKEGE
ncbi:MAG: hypothetical protein IJV02_00115 [Candidatus Methanomethylophilaceae archaeon]|nr:hypothetical protein [Candidatus Methanomethylophilaceae archaeon]MBR1452531.1 hypothetical protein [Candidatus Methanomethylophilaceae archaeon]